MISIPNYAHIIVFSVGVVVTLFLTPKIAKVMRSRGVVGIDVHKLNRPEIPEMCGISIIAGLTVSVLTTSMFSSFINEFFSFLTVTFIAGLIGYLDDKGKLGPRVKPLLTALAGLPILLLGTYDPYPVLPIIGRTRLTIIYPLLVPIAITVTSNAVNMMDPLNGVMTGSGSIVTFTLLISSFFLGRDNAAYLCVCLLGCLLAFYHYNGYPSRVFSGNIGSLAVGAAIGAIVVIGRLEAIGVIALIPHIMNAFYGLASVGHLFERKEITSRPIKILKDGRLAASTDLNAPITLTRTILVDGPKREKEVVNVFLLLTAFSSLLALITTLIMVMK
jgi:UDP-N-acetylglucosamine--dolichyl-phosphate N-acetylglucosaminephosphotransferase